MVFKLLSKSQNISALKLSCDFLQRRFEMRVRYLALVELSQVIILEICGRKVHRKWDFVKHRIDIVIDSFRGKNRLKIEVGQPLNEMVNNKEFPLQRYDTIFREALFSLVHNDCIEESADPWNGTEPFVKTYKITLRGLEFLRKHLLVQGYKSKAWGYGSCQ